MLTVQNQEPQKKYKNPGIGTILGGIAAGVAAQSLVAGVSLAIGLNGLNRVKQISDLPTDEFKQVDAILNKALKDTGLSEKGVTIRKVPTEDANSIQEKLKVLTNPIKGVKQGVNAYYFCDTTGTLSDEFKKTVPKEKRAFMESKVIYRPENNLSLAIFHEIGHAANNQLSKVGKILQKCRPLSIFAPYVILLIGLLKTKKAPDEKPKKTTDKINTFIKNNAGKLTFLATVPMLIEEAMASLKGYKFAEQAGLSKDLLAKVAKTNKVAYFGCYLASAVFGSLGIALAIKVKDAIAHKTPKKVKKAEVSPLAVNSNDSKNV